MMKGLLKEAAQKLKASEDPIRIIAHMGTDGICAASILIKALARLEKKFVVSIVKQLSKDLIKELSTEPYQTIIFLDLGSDNLHSLDNIKDKEIIVIDHHEILKAKTLNLTHINPLEHQIDGAREVSTSGLIYILCKDLDINNKDLAYLAIVGATGDLQENNGFHGLNKEILEEAIGKIEIKPGIKSYGAYTRKLSHFLEYCVDPFIPCLTGDKQKVLQFLKEIGLYHQKDNKIIDLDQESLNILTNALVKKSPVDKAFINLEGDNYLVTLKSGEKIDIREFSTLLNACGRMQHPSMGISLCLNENISRDQLLDILYKYELEIISCLNWFYTHKNNKKITTQGPGFVIVNAEEHIRDTLIGTINTIISMSGLYDPNTIIMIMANTIEGFTKISIRMTNYNFERNLKDLLARLIEGYDGTIGGHTFAAGATIPQRYEDEFIVNSSEVLKNNLLEEEIAK